MLKNERKSLVFHRDFFNIEYVIIFDVNGVAIYLIHEIN